MKQYFPTRVYFCLYGFINQQNCWVWDLELSNEVHETPNEEPSDMLCCAIAKN